MMIVIDRERLTDVVNDAIDRASAGASIEDVLAFMRASGLSMGECVIALGRSGLCERGQVKATVLHSATWADVAPQHEVFVREIEEEFFRRGTDK